MRRQLVFLLGWMKMGLSNDVLTRLEIGYCRKFPCYVMITDIQTVYLEVWFEATALLPTPQRFET